MGQVRQLDERMNAAGYLRLMVPDALVLNMSNTLINVPGTGRHSMPDQASGNLKKKLLNFPIFKKPLLWLYDRIFNWYYYDQQS